MGLLVKATCRYEAAGGLLPYESYCYKVWGEPLEAVDALKDKYMGVAPSYTGHSYDNVLDIYFAHSRFYDPDTRAWMPKDRVREGNR